jgi:transcription elongation GreA/GreB family factor
MSRAFVRESDQDSTELPERAISPHPNFVTPRGLARIESQVRALEAERAAARAGDDGTLKARIARDLRYWSARRASARLVEQAATDRVRFGARVELRLPSGATQVLRLVGEDEADASSGLLSYMAPLARALLGREVGDTVPYQGEEAQVLSIDP